ncbi:5-methyltetrahydrofolate--homocysteine methyltransferase [Sphingomonas sp. MAH-20]|uniref:Methionine synthase n=1 Tax=Sphingomonas horti TaxID=2682842 RepID=A0A6I4IY99_9SPHN|nr:MULTISPECIES: homocysteine S-methyltransferase family protein [Sphingomonas]MBA2918234.1 homocysteine S-methyltransferase family protein [Sphingomonas sp. CGMCC 1.13658]MVO77202.1 5-methyltetrahydrofolate--homocysteine methyltransferase [Sphingomonas horti]
MITSEAARRLRAEAAKRILLTDGAFGTMIQSYRLTEADYRGSLDLGHDQKGNNDLLALTQPQVVAKITEAYLDAGSDIVSTNTFNANAVSQADYGAEHLVRDINLASARIAREAASAAEAADGRPRFVAGAIGPTNKTLSLSPDVNDPGYRAISFDELKAVYREQADALLDGGVDFILIETIFDTLNAKAGIMAAIEAGEARGREVPLMISFTITDMSGRNLSGHSIESFWASVRHARPLTIGLNCSFGAPQLRPSVASLSPIADTLLMVYPNAGLPNDLGAYDESPDTTAGFMRGWADEGLINIVGGCCGTTPDHIRAMADAVAGKVPRAIPSARRQTFLAGLDPMRIAA